MGMAAQSADVERAVQVREQMNIVIVGHVDHGKSTLVGRMLADTGSVDPAKIEKVRKLCEQQGKRFEHAFLLDALEAEQAQGITIDAARCFFKSDARDYIIIDAPGHVEFLKNMISGAARAEAAVLLIDAAEGVRENSRRHGYMLGLLGIRQIVVAVNKMDAVGYDPEVFARIETEYRDFLSQVGIEPAAFIPVSAREGDLIVNRTDETAWFEGPTILQAIDAFRKAPPLEDRPLRLPVQDVYRFNREGDTRRIIAGRVTSGRLNVGDEVVFQPSGKRTRVATIELFNARGTPEVAVAGQSTGFTMTEQIYVDRGDIVCRPDTQCRVSNRFRVNLFWLGRQPLTMGRTYKLKLATFSGLCEVEHIEQVIDASALSDSGHEDRVERHEVAEVVLRLRKPIACDLSHDSEDTGRFVLVDGYDMAGGGIVREVLDTEEDSGAVRWTAEVGAIDRPLREIKHGHRAGVVVVHDDLDHNGNALAGALEETLWNHGRQVYRMELLADDLLKAGASELNLRSIAFGAVAALVNTGQVVVITVPWADDLTHTERLLLPGLEAIPTAQVRFRRDAAPLSDAGEDARDWALDPADEPRAQHDAVYERLNRLLA